jgi:glycosyltransferase involved in cell wall biosynthesis
MAPERPKLTVLTATLNAAPALPRLIACLRAQTDQDFEWIVADGLSTDGAQQLLRDTTDLRIGLDEAADFGIYDALNRGLRHIDGGYYLVVGADDLLEPDAIANFRHAAMEAGCPDFVAAGYRQDRRTRWPRRRLGWLHGVQGMASSHSVGLLIRRELHARFGMYTHKLPIAADQLFIKVALRGGASIARANFIAGEFGTGGTSGSDPLGVLTEIFRVQVRTERIVSLQYLIFLLRLFKYFVFRHSRQKDG